MTNPPAQSRWSSSVDANSISEFRKGLADTFELKLFEHKRNVGAGTQEPEPEKKLAAFEGMLKVHPKFMYKYYIVAYGGQTCALYTDPSVGKDMLKDIKPGTEIRVRGELGTRYRGGGTKTNPSPFGRTWVIYMNVREVTDLVRDKG